MAVEAIVVASMAGLLGVGKVRLVCLSLIANLTTQPLFSAWLIYVTAGRTYTWWQFFAIGEVAVVLIEAVFYYLLLRRRGMSLLAGVGLSTAANLASLAIGLLLPY